MRGKALTLALLMIVSALAGCIEDRKVDSDTTDIIVDDSSSNETTTFIETVENTDSDDCRDSGGTWIEASERGGESYCDMGEDGDEREDDREITQEDCERRNGTWTEAADRPDGFYCDFGEHDDTEDDREITQEDCERRGGNWTEAPDREDQFYCDFGEDDDREDDREITQEDCERRGGNWTEAPDREDQFYCDFGEDDSNSTSNSSPTLTLLGDAELQLNASETEEYTDAGATCTDEEDGDLSANVSVSGEMVDMRTPGEYEIIYTCEDSEGNSVQIRRLVTILEVDTDGDGVADDDDAFPNDASETTDSDGDGTGDNADAFPNDANERADSDGDGVGDNADQCDDTETGATIGDDGCVVNEAQEHFIDISGMAFSESTITISVGDTITWTNQDSAPHSATADDGEFDSGTLSNGDTFSFTFTTAGTYTYHCAIHNGMTATIIVE